MTPRYLKASTLYRCLPSICQDALGQAFLRANTTTWHLLGLMCRSCCLQYAAKASSSCCSSLSLLAISESDIISIPYISEYARWGGTTPSQPDACIWAGVQYQALQPTGKPNPQWLPRGLQPPYVPVPFLNPPPVHWW
jgi:hypothetical protein